MDENFNLPAPPPPSQSPPPLPFQPQSEPHVHNPLEAMQPGEKVICEIKRHPIGMLGKYIAAIFGLLVIGIFAMAIIPKVVPQASQAHVREFALFGIVLVAIITAIGLWISATIYYKNRWIVTSDSITQVSQTGLFSAQTSQLSMANLQDITVIQDGVIPAMFHYGVLRAETAGEQSKFVFIYCPNPKYYAQQILVARENFINSSPEAARRANDELAVPRGPTNGLNINTNT